MDIILQGKHSSEEVLDNLMSVLRLFKEQYHIDQFREIHLMVTLVDGQGMDVELVDTNTSEIYRKLEIYQTAQDIATECRPKPMLQLVIDNTHQHPKN